MAGAGYKAFADGDVLTAAQVQTFLQDQAVMRFADASARTTGLGGAVAEGMVSYLQDTDTVEVYDGSAWVGLGGGFTASTAITATDASWSVPTLADPVVRVTVVAGGAGGSSGSRIDEAGNAPGSGGNNSVFSSSAGTATATGGQPWNSGNAQAKDGLVSDNGGHGGAAYNQDANNGPPGRGGEIVVAYFDLYGVTTASVTVGAGGAGGPSNTGSDPGGQGGDGVVIVEYRAG